MILSGRVTKLLATAALSLGLFAQKYSFEYYSHERGLKSLGIARLLQDRTGYLWVGTTNGLFRYDGWRFRRFDRDDGLPSAVVESLALSPDGTVWVGTRSGVARLEGEHFVAAEAGVRYQILARNGLDVGADARVYAGTSNGLAIVTNGHIEFVRVPGVSHKTAYGVHAAPDGSVWFGCDDRLCLLRRGEVRVFGPEDGVPRDRWDAILTDRQGTLWVRSSQRLVMRARGDEAFTSQDDGLPQAGFSGALYQDSEGQLYAPTDRGLARRTPDGWEVIGVANGLDVESTTSVIEDRDGSLWIGLWGAGLARWTGYSGVAGMGSQPGVEQQRGVEHPAGCPGPVMGGNRLRPEPNGRSRRDVAGVGTTRRPGRREGTRPGAVA